MTWAADELQTGILEIFAEAQGFGRRRLRKSIFLWKPVNGRPRTFECEWCGVVTKLTTERGTHRQYCGLKCYRAAVAHAHRVRADASPRRLMQFARMCTVPSAP